MSGLAFSYAEFENRFRGTSEDVRREQRALLPFFRGVPGPVLDLGCGRGEFLELLREEGISASGVDSCAEMLAQAIDRGVVAREAEALDALSRVPDGSLGGIFMAHVIEHLPKNDVPLLARLAALKLAPCGVLVIETLNPACLFSAAPFSMDLTHEWPIHPLTLQFLLEHEGLGGFELIYRQYLPDDMLSLLPSPPPEPQTPLEAVLLQAVGKLQLLVDLAFRNFIYALVARKPASSSAEAEGDEAWPSASPEPESRKTTRAVP